MLEGLFYSQSKDNSVLGIRLNEKEVGYELNRKVIEELRERKDDGGGMDWPREQDLIGKEVIRSLRGRH